jgi:hypothetical protein
MSKKSKGKTPSILDFRVWILDWGDILQSKIYNLKSKIEGLFPFDFL